MVRPPGSEMIYNDVTEKIGTAIDAAGAVITVAWRYWRRSSTSRPS
jgi:hypothetical protein